ncbi:hypothetical protein IMW63_00250 [Ehrlichia ruminantium]|uniref:hypothetical protein n=1 Tax=Ehrlichia ruminantium TaxID=779 RepID=UPI001FB40D07|nr:hypothetical protein [Ehrlichia ruminantium]UOD98828.1 hypothetical protein IMW63_00250 [Ehrlichia ruminantium]
MTHSLFFVEPYLSLLLIFRFVWFSRLTQYYILYMISNDKYDLLMVGMRINFLAITNLNNIEKL